MKYDMKFIFLKLMLRGCIWILEVILYRFVVNYIELVSFRDFFNSLFVVFFLYCVEEAIKRFMGNICIYYLYYILWICFVI